MLVRPYGTIISTPGTEFINDAKYDTSGLSDDDIDEDVILYLEMEGTNGSTTFTDSSSYNHSISATGGNVAISTAQYKFGGSSALYQYVAVEDEQERIYVADNDVFDIHIAQDRTYELWMRWTDLAPAGNGNNNFYYQVGPNSDLIRCDADEFVVGSVRFGFNMTDSGSGSGVAQSSDLTPSLNEWHHIAYVKSSSTLNIYLDGSNIASATFSAGFVFAAPNSAVVIGQRTDGYMDSFIITNRAKYTSNFTPPTGGRNYGRSRLIPFVFSRNDAYAIEAGETYFRFYTNGGVVNA